MAFFGQVIWKVLSGINEGRSFRSAPTFDLEPKDNDITIDDAVNGGVRDMCNLSEIVWEKGKTEGGIRNFAAYSSAKLLELILGDLSNYI